MTGFLRKAHAGKAHAERFMHLHNPMIDCKRMHNAIILLFFLNLTVIHCFISYLNCATNNQKHLQQGRHEISISVSFRNIKKKKTINLTSHVKEGNIIIVRQVINSDIVYLPETFCTQTEKLQPHQNLKRSKRTVSAKSGIKACIHVHV